MARERAAVPDYVGAMVRRSPPEQCPVVPGSRPVVAFGDPTRAEVATLGINPSVHEFVEDGRLLAGDLRRLATLDALGAVDCSELTVEQVAAVVADCAAYFQQRPYRRWFDPLDKLLRAGTDASYYDGSACHLDLVQWATDPTWSKLPGDVQQALLDDGVPHLRAQLSRENVRLVVLNGRQVLTQAEALGPGGPDRGRPASGRSHHVSAIHGHRRRRPLAWLVDQPAEQLGRQRRVQAAARCLARRGQYNLGGRHGPRTHRGRSPATRTARAGQGRARRGPALVAGNLARRDHRRHRRVRWKALDLD